MRKKLFFILLFLLLIPINISAASYDIITYNIDIIVNENRTIDVKEEYNIYFTQSGELKKKLTDKILFIRSNNSKFTNKIKISNVSLLKNNEKVDYKYNNNEITTSINDKIGNVENYVISYSYDYGKDSNNTIDELMIDIINGLEVNVSNANFKIEFPKDFDTSKIKFLENSNYIDDDIIYNINNNVVTGFVNKNVDSNISMYIEFPNNYFVGAVNHNKLSILILIAPIITIIIGIINYSKYCKNNKLKITLNENITNEYNSAEIAYLYKGYLTEHDLMTIFISLANNGYIRFIESDDGYKLGTFNSFVIEKIKDYDQDNAVVKILFEKIFQQKDMVELKDIEYNLYDTLVDAKSTIDNEENKDKLFFKDVKKSKNIIKLLIALSVIIVNFNSIYLFTEKYYLVPIISALMLLGIYLVFRIDNKILIKIFGIIFMISTLYIGIVPYIDSITSILIYLFGIVLILVTSYIHRIIPERTKYGNEVLSEIYGFKRMLEQLSDNEIKEKMSINSNYYYDMYPYIYVLELTNMWVKKFEGIIDKYPDWYITKEEFSLNNFQNFIKNMIFTITQAMFKRQLTGQSSVHVEYHKDSIKQSKLL